MKARSLICTLGVLAALPVMTTHALAQTQPVPDVMSDQTSITYTVSGTTGHLVATGVAEKLTTDPTGVATPVSLTGGNFVLHGDFTLSGGAITGFTGDVTVADGSHTYFNSSTLTTLSNVSDVFTFTFANGTGAYPGEFKVVLHGDDSTNFSSFAAPFSNTLPIAYSDTYSVPEPASLGVIGIGGMLLLRRRRARA